LKFRKKKGWQVLVGHPQEIKERMFSTQGFFFFFNPRELAQELLEE
jgi:hypothetical protein